MGIRDVASECADELDAELSAREAAEFSSFSLKALRQWREAGTGPEYTVTNRGTIRYTRAALWRWHDKMLCHYHETYCW